MTDCPHGLFRRSEYISFSEFRDVWPCRYRRWGILPAWFPTAGHVAGAKGPSSQGGPGSPGKPPSLVADSGTRRKRKRPSSPCRPRRSQDVSVSLCSLFRPNLLVLSSPSPGPSEILPKPLTPVALPGWVGLFLVRLPPPRKGIKHMTENPEKGMEYITIRGETKIPIPCDEEDLRTLRIYHNCPHPSRTFPLNPPAPFCGTLTSPPRSLFPAGFCNHLCREPHAILFRSQLIYPTQFPSILQERVNLLILFQIIRFTRHACVEKVIISLMIFSDNPIVSDINVF